MEVVIKLSPAEEGAILQQLAESMPRYEDEPGYQMVLNAYAPKEE